MILKQTRFEPAANIFQHFKNPSNTYNLAKVKSYYPLMSEWLGVKTPDSISLNYERFYQPADTMVNKPNIILVICESFKDVQEFNEWQSIEHNPLF